MTNTDHSHDFDFIAGVWTRSPSLFARERLSRHGTCFAHLMAFSRPPGYVRCGPTGLHDAFHSFRCGLQCRSGLLPFV